MSVVAIYNLKGGVGKTTTAVNLSYLSAAAGRRTLLWDLDPQGASSFAFRIQPGVAGFGKKSLEGGDVLATAIKATDFDRLDLLPADFAYRKLDRLLDDCGKPHRVMANLFRTLGRDYDVIVLDCPPGFSLLIEAVFVTSDLIVVPTIPTVLSLRTLARLIKWADRCDRLTTLTAFLSMVDRRKTIHRRACQWATLHPQIFLSGQIPYASVVEQMAVRRMPLPAFASGDPAALACREIWAELQQRLDSRGTPVLESGSSLPLIQSIEALIAGFDSPDTGAPASPQPAPSGTQFIHRFDTEQRDLERYGCALELCERSDSFLLTATRSAGDRDERRDETAAHVQAQVDARWATQILSGGLSPLVALERRLGKPTPVLVCHMRSAVGDRTLRRISSASATSAIRVA